MKSCIDRGVRALIAAGLVFVWTASTAVAAESIRDISSEVCETCHKDIYKQWKDSMEAWRR
jgi:hypothetical protein